MGWTYDDWYELGRLMPRELDSEALQRWIHDVNQELKERRFDCVPQYDMAHVAHLLAHILYLEEKAKQ